MGVNVFLLLEKRKEARIKGRQNKNEIQNLNKRTEKVWKIIQQVRWMIYGKFKKWIH